MNFKKLINETLEKKYQLLDDLNNRYDILQCIAQIDILKEISRIINNE